MSREPQPRGDSPVLDFTDDTATLGDRLTLAREAAGLDPGQLAQRIGVRPQTLRNWEEDRAEPRANRLQMLAGMLNVSMIWLMSGEGEVPRAVNLSDGPAAGDVLAELRRIHHDQRQIAGRMSRLEKRLRAVLSQAS
jgi:HTH-type transcriptional regulator, cell division transcriptional repressor